MVTSEKEWWETSATPADISSAPTFACLAAVEAVFLSAVTTPHRGHVLDLGCGPGRLTCPAAEAYPYLDFLGIDISERHIRDAQVSYGYGATFEANDGRTLPSRPLIGAYSVLTFQHLPHAATASYIAQMSALLAPGALLIFQHVRGTSDTFLSHQVSDWDMPYRWCVDAGLVVEHIREGLVEEEWVWVTARKPA